MLKGLFVRGAAVAAGVGALAAQAMADVPTSVNTAITDAGTDAATIGGLVLVVIVGIAAFKFMRRAL
ncbi:phage coat protein [Pseudomonas nitroreducens]|uniref:major capsid protein n=1 Tax=Pseudomonas nitroreducens TaxID=46680 RepID=UPI002446FBD5|nr:major capsid protein [Pseudomonas nitroreducens]ELN4693600.1 phage coat protein [Escherichia coli]ELN4703186.1 phage coat protein [Escherichia coli]MDG9858475.1 phage coat protein [Pseudomonas nitroreducens]MDH1077264.1 phage coat protein [Pseudomonas nitroreducens]